MVFSSLTFIFLFLPIVLITYFLMPNRTTKNIVLFLSSLIFYAWGEPVYIILMLITIINNYTFSLLVEKEKKKENAGLAKLYFISSIVINVGILGFFKYADFLIGNINGIFGLNIAALDLPLPIGISFYTFQIMSYSIDVYMGKLEAQRKILILATYVTLFPQLIAGPIVRYSTIKDELETRIETVSQVAQGIRRFIIGLGKKVIIANQMGLIADTIFNSKSSEVGTLLMWFAVICFTLQIYYDFSGYSDMAIGLGLIFGFHFLENFNYPYISRNITEFWRRWHISLSSWFRDYIYIPLGGNRKRVVLNLLIVWLLTGFWHGASWNFVLWGFYYFLLLVIEKYFLKEKLSKLPNVLQHIYALFFIMMGWIIFKIEDVTQLGEAFKTLFIYEGSEIKSVMFNYQEMLYAIPFIIIAVIGSTPLIKNLFIKMEENNLVYIKVLKDIYFMGILIISIIFLVGSTFNPFIYFKF